MVLQTLQPVSSGQGQEQLGWIRGNGAARYQVETRNDLRPQYRLQRLDVGHQFAQAGAAFNTKNIVQVALAHVGINQQNTLAGGCHDGRQVGTDERFPDSGRRASEHDDAVGRMEHGKLQRGAQTAQALDRKICRIGNGQQMRSALAGLDGLIQRRLARARGYVGIDTESGFLLNLVGRPDACAQMVAQQACTGARHQAQQAAQQQDDQPLGLDGCFWNGGRVDDAHAAHLALLDQPQLLQAVEQAGVELIVDLDVARQAQQLPLDARKLAGARLKGGHL